MLNILKKVSLLNCNERLYTGAVFKNCYYNLLELNKKTINIFDCHLDYKYHFDVCNEYNSITRTTNNNLFYTTKKGDNENIYIIDSKYNEIDRIILKVSNEYKGEIKSISCDKNNSKIIITLKNKVYSVTTNGDFIKEEISKSSMEKISSVYKNDRIIKGLNGCCQNKFTTIYEPIFTFAGIFCNKLFITYIKDNSLYLSELSNNGNIVETYYIDDNIEVNTILDVNNNMQLLVTKNGKYNYIYITDYCCRCKKDINNYCFICNDCHLDCKNECYPECKKCCKCHESDIIESIALIEASLSHILNAEGEKIQKALQMSDNVCDLIKTNESVSKTITHITLLEEILFEKLQLVHSKNCDTDNCKK